MPGITRHGHLFRDQTLLETNDQQRQREWLHDKRLVVIQRGTLRFGERKEVAQAALESIQLI